MAAVGRTAGVRSVSFEADFEHRDELLRAAVTEFCERGYENASINRILDSCGMSKGQLYHHFGSKEVLYLELVGWMIARKIDWLQSHPPEMSDDFFATIREHVRASVAFARAHPDVDCFVRSVLAERGRPIFRTVGERYGFTADGPLGDLVERCHEQGQFGNDLTLDFVRKVVTALVNQIPELVDLDRPSDLDARIDEFLAFLEHGLRGSTHRRGSTPAAGARRKAL